MLRANAALAVAAFALMLLAQRSTPPLLVDVGGASDERYLQDWHVPEAGDGLTFRWSRPGSHIVLHGAPGGVEALIVRLNPGPNPRRVSIVGGKSMATVEIVPGWHEYRFQVLLPDGPWPSLEPQALEVLCDQYATAHDGRRLGVMFDWIRLEPEAPGRVLSRPIVVRASFLAWTALVLVGLLTWLDRLLFPAGDRARGVRVAALSAIPVLALVWLTHHDPYLAAWAFPPMPVGLVVVSLILLIKAALPRRAPALPVIDAESPWASGRTGVFLVLLLAAALRFHDIRSLPFGLWHDEARHGLVALRMLEDRTYRPVYVAERHMNLPAFGLYAFTLPLWLWGVHAWSLRTLTALAGALTVLPLCALATELRLRRDVALLAAALLAVSSWHLTLSRFSFPAIFDPLLTLTALWMLARGLERAPPRSRPYWLAGAGIATGLAVQTYHSARVAPLLVFLLAALLRRKPVAASVFLPLVVGFGLVAAPLLGYVVRHPGSFNERVADVALMSHAARNGQAPLAALDASLGRHLLMFNVKGDQNGRHHAPGRPLLDYVTGLGFLSGLAVLIACRSGPVGPFLIGGLVVTVLPSLLAVDGPHAMRSIGAIAFACLIAALGWIEVARRTRWPRVYLLAALGVALLLNAHTYFVIMAADPQVWGASYPVHTQVGTYVRDLVERQGVAVAPSIYVSTELADNAVMDYLTHGLPVSTFEGSTLSRAAEPGDLFVVSTHSQSQDVQLLAPYLGSAPIPIVFGPPFPAQSTPSFVVYRAGGS